MTDKTELSPDFFPEVGSLSSMAEVFARARGSALMHHNQSFDRLMPVCSPETAPKFLIDCTKPQFAIGSCFARNIEAHLRALGVPVPVFDHPLSYEEWSGAPEQIVNKYTPATIHAVVAWCHGILKRGDGFQPSDAELFLYEVGDGLVIDGGIWRLEPLDRARAIERRRKLFDYYRHMFAAESVIITFGYTETWWDMERRWPLEQAPTNKLLQDRYPERFGYSRLTFAQCKAYMLETFRLLNDIGGAKQFLITTSPVPVAATFSGEDVIVANMYTKSLLRGLSGELVNERADVDYFPSYESVLLTRDWSVYDEDRRHVSQQTVGYIMMRVLETHFRNVPEQRLAFVRAAALMHEGDREGALGILDRLLSVYEDHIEGWRQKGLCLHEMGRHAEAAEALRTVCRIKPGDGPGTGMLVYLLALTGQAAEAVRLGEDYLARVTAGGMVERMLSFAYLKAGQQDRCEAILDRLMPGVAGDPILCFVRSYWHEDRGELADALDAARKAAQLYENYEPYKVRMRALEAAVAETGGQ